jgi:hypothetical protein
VPRTEPAGTNVEGLSIAPVRGLVGPTGTADDHEDAGPGILTYDEAQGRARIVARGGEPNGQNSVEDALNRYEADLRRAAVMCTTPHGPVAISPRSWSGRPSAR